MRTSLNRCYCQTEILTDRQTYQLTERQVDRQSERKNRKTEKCRQSNRLFPVIEHDSEDAKNKWAGMKRFCNYSGHLQMSIDEYRGGMGFQNHWQLLKLKKIIYILRKSEKNLRLTIRISMFSMTKDQVSHGF